MATSGSPKTKRQAELSQYLRENPFCTDDELAEAFSVSVQTIRLDRLSMGIPEVRKRIKSVAEEAYGKVRSLDEGEIIGELIDIKLGEYAISMLEINEDMVSEQGHIRGHLLFAQANSLSIAVIDSDLVLTGNARVRYKRPVLLGEKVIAKAVVKTGKGNSYLVSVASKADSELVFKGHFIMFAQDQKESQGGS